MTEQWEIFERKIKRIKGRINENQKELQNLEIRLKFAEMTYEKWQLESNGDEPLDN